MLQIIRVVGGLPGGFDLLLAEARNEGVRNMTLLADQWGDDPDLTLFAAFVDGELAGVGGVSPEATMPAMRMRRLYVRPPHRRQSVGRALAGAMMQQGLAVSEALTVNARASAAAAPFWEAMGFEPVEGAGFTHWLSR